MKDKKFWQVHLKWGLILGLLFVAIEVLKMFARKVDYQASQLLDIAMIIGVILALYHGVREYKENYPDRLSFAKAFRSALVMSVVAAAVIFCYDIFHYSVIEKDGLQRKYDAALAKYKSNLTNDTVSNSEIDTFIETANKLIDENRKAVVSDISDNDSLCLEISQGCNVFQQYYSEKILSKPEKDAESYTLGSFLQYARKVLVETLVSYSEQNDGKQSTIYVQKIVQNTNAALVDADPLDVRFEQNKNRVPHYDKNGQYAAISAAIYLLYGMFFGIFVAMFHYRSKNAIDEVPESQEDEDATNEVKTKE